MIKHALSKQRGIVCVSPPAGSSAYTPREARRHLKIDLAAVARAARFRMIDPRWLLTVMVDWLVIVVAFAIAGYVGSLLVYWIASLVIGNRIHALGVMGHDGAHGNAARMPWLNDLLTGVLIFWPAGLTVSGYRRFHFAHHRFLGTARDPEQAIKHWTTPEWRTPFHLSEIAICFAKDMMGYGAIDLVRITHAHRPQKTLAMTGPLCATIALWWFCWGHWWILALWYFSLATSFWAVIRLRTYLEHVGTMGPGGLSYRGGSGPCWLRIGLGCITSITSIRPCHPVGCAR